MKLTPASYFVVGALVFVISLIHLGSWLFFKSREIVWTLETARGTERLCTDSYDGFENNSELQSRIRSCETSILRGYTFVPHRLVFEAHMRNGVFDGPRREWYNNGVLLSYSYYTNGVPDGWTTNYYPSGSPEYTSFYAEGIERRSITWYNNGVPMSDYEHTSDGKSYHERHWTDTGNLFADSWIDASMRATSGIQCVSWNPSSVNPPLLLDVAGRTNISLEAAITILNRTWLKTNNWQTLFIPGNTEAKE